MANWLLPKHPNPMPPPPQTNDGKQWAEYHDRHIKQEAARQKEKERDWNKNAQIVFWCAIVFVVVFAGCYFYFK